MASQVGVPVDEDSAQMRLRISSKVLNSARAAGMPEQKKNTYIARLIICLEECLRKLGVTTETHADLLSSLEGMSCFIHESMSISSRNYHSVQHVFDVVNGLDNDDDPIAVIAALFHDCVYYHVDGGLSDLQYAKLQGVISSHSNAASTHSGENGGAYIPGYQAQTSTPSACDNDDEDLLCMVEKVFGYTQGQAVNHQNGLNEFLSAVICVRELQPFLSKPVLAQLACCIEATIPFRSNNPETGQTCMEKLHQQLDNVNTLFHLGLSKDELVTAVQRSADLANSDVANFGTSDVLWFLDNTWSLLPESNEGLRRQYLSSVQQFQFAVFKMYGFFNFLKAEVVFPHFQGIPPPALHEERVAHAKRNLQLGRTYVRAKLLSLSVLAAFAELTGGDAPISLFMGDLPSRHGGTTMSVASAGQTGVHGKRNSGIHSFAERIVEESEEYPDDETATNIDADVYEVLSKGRRTETNFDVKQSPMAAYLYSILGDNELQAIFKDLQVHPMTQERALALLKRLPKDAVEEIAQKIGNIAISRTEKIWRLVNGM